MTIQTESLTITSSAELEPLWQVLALSYVDTSSPVWYDFHSLKPFDSLPEGALQFIDVQVRDFNNLLTYFLVVGLASSKGRLLLCLDLHSVAALSLVEPLCFLPDSFLDVYLVLHHELLELAGNTCVKFKVQVGKAVLNAPLSSLAGWQSVCFRRVRQLQAKLRNYTPLELQFEVADS